MKNEKTYTPAEMLEIARDLQDAITTKHTGKMAGMYSISSSTALNPNCAKYAAVKGSICGHCYARAQLKRYGKLAEKLERNTALLTGGVLPVEVLPRLNCLYFRFEAFGDLINAAQVVNYFNIAKSNPLVNCAIWTKNPHIIAQAMKEYGAEKPENLNIIYSSIFMNDVNAAILKRYPFIDKVFTVFDAGTIESENIAINCGARSCASCLNCYLKGGDTFINEKLK